MTDADALARFQDAIDRGLSYAEAQEEGWPSTDDDPDGGVRVPVRPKPTPRTPAAALAIPRVLECV